MSPANRGRGGPGDQGSPGGARPKFIEDALVPALVGALVGSGALGLFFGYFWLIALGVLTVGVLAATRMRNRRALMLLGAAWIGLALSFLTAVILKLLG
ncbi:hypothetical protein JT358_05100 [Micrococcales bacterium 31B]|nr:hypothetical protein [Micrococcales bacterium 31B]